MPSAKTLGVIAIVALGVLIAAQKVDALKKFVYG